MDRKQNVHYRPAKKDTCITCRNRIFLSIHDADGRLAGQDFRCPIRGIKYPISDGHTCDEHRPVRQVQQIVDPEMLQW